MTRKIFNSILSTAVVVLCSSLIIITGFIYRYFGNLQHSQLKDQLTLASHGVHLHGTEYLGRLSLTQYRMTLIRSDGTVIYDSHTDPSSLGNHSDREEIMEAVKTGEGSSIRHSLTLTERTIYEAVRLENGNILRISASHATVFVLIFHMMGALLLILFLAVLLSSQFAKRMAHRIVEPLNRLDLEHPMDNDAYEELSPLLYRIHAQQEKIHHQLDILTVKQKEFDQIIIHMKEALILLNQQGRILSINPAAKLLFSIDQPCISEDFLFVERNPKMQNAYMEAKMTGHADFQGKKKGRYYHFDLNKITSDNIEHGMVILAFDVTEQRNAEKHRREFTANVSHELKTPLQSIIGSAELLEHGIVKQEDIPRFVERIRKEADRLLSLINNILYLSRLDEEERMPEEKVCLTDLAKEAAENLLPLADRRSITLTVEGEDVYLSGVRQLLYDLIYNLCENAIKYNKDGGRVNISLSKDSTCLNLQVNDTGIGIPLKHQSKIFERFYRVDKSHSRSTGGTGLGLSIVKHIVQYHRGKITLTSREDEGTAITITFPHGESNY